MGFAENFIAGHQAGQQRKQQEQAFTDAQEERGIRKMLLELQLRHDKAQEAIETYKLKKGAASDQFDALNGTPESALTPEMMEGGTLPMRSPPNIPGMPLPQPTNRMAPVQFPGLPEEMGGGGGYSKTPQSQEQGIAAQLDSMFRTAMMTPYTLNEGDRRVVGNRVIAEGAPKAPPRAPSKSMEQQLLEAEQSGNAAQAAQIRRVMNARDVNMGKPADSNSALVKAVMEHPELYDRLSAKEIADIAPSLNAAGFTSFGKAMTEGAIAKIGESKSALGSLRDLRQTLQDNEQYIGPVAGLAALNPYSDARKAQAKIDLVKQRVGKALEGGVLRKEDEGKYKKILATLSDEPSTAIYKVDSVITALERDLETFVDAQRGAGRRVDENAPSGARTTKIGRFDVQEH